MSRPTWTTLLRPVLELLEDRIAPATIHWNNAAGGAWHVPANWDLNRVPAAADDVVIDLPGTYTVAYSTGTSLVSSLRADRAFSMTGGTLEVAGPLLATGPFVLQGGQLRGATVTGESTVLVRGAGATLQDVVIAGRVRSEATGALALAGRWRNNGLIELTRGQLLLGGTFTTAAIGSILRTGGSVTVTGALDNTGAVLRLNAKTSSWDLRTGASVTGGTLATEHGAVFMVVSTGEPYLDLRGVTINGTIRALSGPTRVTGGLTLHGTFDAAAGVGSALVFEGSQMLSGTGTVVPRGGGGSDGILGSNGIVTLGPGITVRGARASAMANFRNLGLIDVSVADADLRLGGSWRNEGIISLSAGSLLLGGTVTPGVLGTLRRTGGELLLAGTWDNRGQTLTLTPATGSLRFRDGGTILGGSVTGSGGATLSVGPLDRARLDGVELRTDVRVDGQLEFAGVWRNHATLDLRGEVRLGGTFTRGTLGDLRQNGGRVGIVGVLNLAGDQLTLDESTGPWYVQNGTILGGTVVTSAGRSLVIEDSALCQSHLAGVVFRGNVLVPRGCVRVTGGLTLDGTMTLQTFSYLRFEGRQSLGGNGTVLLSGQVLGGTYGMVTLGPGITIRGTGTLQNFVNEGRIEATGSIFTLEGTWSNHGTILIPTGGFDLRLRGTFTSDTFRSIPLPGATSLFLNAVIDNRAAVFDLGLLAGRLQTSDVVIRGGTVVATSGDPLQQKFTLDGVTLAGDVEFGNLVTLTGAWRNLGTLTIHTGLLTLGGTFRSAELRNVQLLSGSAFLTGVVDNRGADLFLPGGNGWHLHGGTIEGGTVTLAAGTFLRVDSETRAGGRLHGVHVRGGLVVPSGNVLTVRDGLRLDGELVLGAPWGKVVFEGAQALDGAATVILGSTSAENLLEGRNGVLTLSQGVTVTGLTGTVANFVNRGTFTAFDLTLQGNLWRNEGVLLVDGSSLALGGTFVRAALGDFRRTGGTVTITGTLENTGSTLTLDAVTGSWQLGGGGVIRGGVLTTAQGASLVPAGGALDGVRIETDITVVPGAVFILRGAFSNLGRLTLAGGQVGLWDAVTLGMLGDFRQQAGEVRVLGQLDLAGQTLNFDNPAVFWSLGFGRIANGRIITGGTSRLVVAGPGTPQLDRVAVDGRISVQNGTLLVSGGLTLNGELDTNFATIRFQGDQTIDGAATITLRSSTFNTIGAPVAPTVTLGPGIILRGGPVGSVVNRGRIEAVGALSLTGAWRNEGVIVVPQGATLALGGEVTTAGLGTIQSAGGLVWLAGTVDNQGATFDLATTAVGWGFGGGVIRGGLVTAPPGYRLPDAQNLVLDGAVVEGAIIVGSPGTTLALRGAWSVRDHVRLDEGTLNLGGAFSAADLGRFQLVRGEVILTGDLDNNGGEVNVTAAVPWTLRGGTIHGGRVTTAPGTQFPIWAGRLDGVTAVGTVQLLGTLTLANGCAVNGNLETESATVTVEGGLTVNGVWTLNNSVVSFDGTQVLSGSGTVVFGDGARRVTTFQAPAGTLTIPGGFLVRGGRGELLNVVNQGMVLVESNTSVVTFGGPRWRNEGVVRLDAGALNLGGEFVSAALGDIRRLDGTLNLTGLLDLEGRVFTLGAAAGPWALRGGEVRNGTLRAAAGTALLATPAGGTLNSVALELDLDVSASAVLTLGGSWSNRGRLSVLGGTLNLGGTFSAAALGEFESRDGTVNLTGRLDNEGRTLALDPRTGSWRLDGGVIAGGTVTTAPGIRLVADSARGGRLERVTLDSDLQVSNAAIQVVGGLTVNGTITLGADQRYGALLFPETQALTGTGVVRVHGEDARNGLVLTASGTTLTLGPALTVRGGGAALGYSAAWAAQATNLGLVTAAALWAEAPAQALRLAGTTLVQRGTLTAVDGGQFALERREAAGGILNEGLVLVGSWSSLTANATYQQSGGVTVLMGGTITVPLLDLRDGVFLGTGTVNGDMRNSGFLGIGLGDRRGTLLVSGNYTQTGTGTLAMTLGGRQPGEEYDQLRVGGTAALSGLLSIAVLDGFFAQPGDLFTLVEYGGRAGAFSAYEGLNPPGQEVHFDPSYTDTSFGLLAVPN